MTIGPRTDPDTAIYVPAAVAARVIDRRRDDRPELHQDETTGSMRTAWGGEQSWAGS